jgi:hypothetical protein
MDAVARYRDSMLKGIAYMLAKQEPSGAIAPKEQGIGGYYKLPYALQVAGKWEECLRLLDWVRKHDIGPDGDFGKAFPRGDIHTTYYIYSNSWIVMAAQRCSQFDLSYKGWDWLRRRQHESGNWPMDGKGTLGIADLWSNALLGYAAIIMGDCERAFRTGDLCLRILEEQPEIDRRLYFVWDSEKGLVTEAEPGKERMFWVDCSQPEQFYISPGAAAMFLGRLYMASSEEKYIQGARRYLDFHETCHDDRYAFSMTCKIAWGAGIVYGITGEKKYGDMAMAAADYLVSIQRPDGGWMEEGEGRTEAMNNDATNEFCCILGEVIEGLSRAQRQE